MVTAERAGVQRTRHTLHFKPYNDPLPDEPRGDEGNLENFENTSEINP